jgi:hypothetical protein
VKTALIRIGPIVKPSEHVWRKADPGRYYYASGALRLPAAGVPLVISHDLEREVGWVDELLERDDDQHGKCIYATGYVDEPVSWLRERGKASIAWHQDDAITGPADSLLVIRGEVVEVTLREPGGKPARDPIAELVKLERTGHYGLSKRQLARAATESRQLGERIDAALAAPSDRLPAEVATSATMNSIWAIGHRPSKREECEELRARIDREGDNPDFSFERILEGLKADLGYHRWWDHAAA